MYGNQGARIFYNAALNGTAKPFNELETTAGTITSAYRFPEPFSGGWAPETLQLTISNPDETLEFRVTLAGRENIRHFMIQTGLNLWELPLDEQGNITELTGKAVIVYGTGEYITTTAAPGSIEKLTEMAYTLLAKPTS